MSGHTEGLVLVAQGSGTMVISDGRVPAIAQTIGPQSRENARRIVACWNACDGVPTEALEGSAKLCSAKDSTLAELKAERAQLIQQRTEMLDLLARIVKADDEFRNAALTVFSLAGKREFEVFVTGTRE